MGPEPLLLHDAHHRLTPAEAGGLGRSLEEYRLFWLEDAVLEELQDGYRLVRHHTTTPLAVGEVFNSIYDCDRLVRKGWIDYLRASVLHAGGISHLRKIAAFAEPYHVRMGCHGAADLSPITMAAAAHFGLAVHNVAIQEYAEHSRRRLQGVPSRMVGEPGLPQSRETAPAWGSTSTRGWPQVFPINAVTCPLANWPTGPRGTGDLGTVSAGNSPGPPEP